MLVFARHGVMFSVFLCYENKCLSLVYNTFEHEINRFCQLCVVGVLVP